MLGSGAGATAYAVKKKKIAAADAAAPSSLLPLPSAGNAALRPPPAAAAAATNDDDDAAVADDSIRVRNPRPAKHQMFGVPTRYFTSGSEFYVPLTRLEEYLQWDPETALFQAIVSRIDVFVGQHLLLASGKAISGIAIPVEAQKIRNDIIRALSEIVEFSHTERKAEMKRTAMLELVDEIKKLLDGNIANMHKVVASRPLRASPAARPAQ